MPLTELGYKRPTFDEIINNQELNARKLFGEDIELGETTPLGKFIRIIAYDLARAYEDVENVFFARFPNTATGQNLDRLCVFVGISRTPATWAMHKVKAVGTVGYIIPAGFLVATNGDLVFYTTTETTIGEDGTCELIVTCEQAGTVGNVEVGKILKVVNPDSDVESVEHIAIVALGEPEEDDEALRKRFAVSVSGIGAANAEAIRATVARINTVLDVIVVENNTSQVDEKGRPPHSFECFVHGGESKHQEIAQGIYSKKPIGIKAISSFPEGNMYRVDEKVVGSNGFEHAISFSHTENIFIKCNVKIKTSPVFGNTEMTQLQDNMSEFINSLGVGKEVIVTSLFGSAYRVAGVEEVTEITVAISSDGGATYGDFSINNVPCEYWQVAKSLPSNIIVEVLS